ncbi:hypothetical protein PSEUDO9AG_40585 [Pseudomonas sp. 9Ag]|nr:hypothetical protein PSEUDO9AG_40585 [Pseudomonas sp. 9Ag]
MAGIIRAASSATSANPHTRGIIRLQFPADATELCRRRSGGHSPMVYTEAERHMVVVTGQEC